MSFLSELAGLCPSAPRSALAWAADFLSDNGFLSVAELAGADPGDLEGWSVTAAVNVQTVLSLIKAASARKNCGASQQRRRGAARVRQIARAGAPRQELPGKARVRSRDRHPRGGKGPSRHRQTWPATWLTGLWSVLAPPGQVRQPGRGRRSATCKPRCGLNENGRSGLIQRGMRRFLAII